MSDANEQNYVIKLRPQTQDAWDAELGVLKNAHDIMETLRESGVLSIHLDNLIHKISFHYSLHVARWITENKKLVEQYAHYDKLNEEETNILKEEIKNSLNKLKKDY